MSALFTALRPLRNYPEPEPVATVFADVGHPYATAVPFVRNCRFKAEFLDREQMLVVHCLYVTTRGRRFYAESRMPAYLVALGSMADAQMRLTREAFRRVEQAVIDHNRDTLPIRN